ncbi:tyrosine-protein phosphatase [bacterium]|nr:tyrosine-protein phosphatase [bacterium]
MNKIIKLILIFCLCLFAYAGWIKYRSMDYSDGGPPLAVRWEGAYHDYNFRDIGASLNQCLGKQIFRPDMIMRSAGWFSGWSCEDVGNPEIIYSLNYSPVKKERYFCQKEDGKIIGRYFNENIKLNDLEFIENWSNKEMKDATCRFLEDIFQSTINAKKTLIHCTAGRDRTGTFSALIIALTAEHFNLLDQPMIDAIECDYQKTESLTKEKHGRIRNFLRQIQTQGSISQFIEQQCDIPESTIKAMAEKMINPALK